MIASSTEDAIATATAAVAELAIMARRAAPEWIPAVVLPSAEDESEPNPPDDSRAVLVFINGDVTIDDSAGRAGGGWGVRLGFYDHDKRRWRAGGQGYDNHVTHWMEMPAAPALASWPPVRA